MPENEQPNRKSDWEHLNSIPVMLTHIDYIRASIDEIKDTIKPVPVMKNDISWLKGWHWKIVIGIISAIAVGMVGLIWSLIK